MYVHTHVIQSVKKGRGHDVGREPGGSMRGPGGSQRRVRIKATTGYENPLLKATTGYENPLLKASHLNQDLFIYLFWKQGFSK